MYMRNWVKSDILTTIVCFISPGEGIQNVWYFLSLSSHMSFDYIIWFHFWLHTVVSYWVSSAIYSHLLVVWSRLLNVYIIRCCSFPPSWLRQYYPTHLSRKSLSLVWSPYSSALWARNRPLWLPCDCGHLSPPHILLALYRPLNSIIRIQGNLSQGYSVLLINITLAVSSHLHSPSVTPSKDSNSQRTFLCKS